MYLCLYFCLVASPPRMCLCALFISRTSLTFIYNDIFICFNRSDTSLWTVDLDTPNFFAALLTVLLFFIMYLPNSTALSSTKPFNYIPPEVLNTSVKYMRKVARLYYFNVIFLYVFLPFFNIISLLNDSLSMEKSIDVIFSELTETPP